MRLNGQIRAGSDTIFQEIFHVAKPSLNRSANRFLMDSLGPRNLGFAHAEYVVGVNPAALHFRESGKGGAELLGRHLALVQLTRRQGHKKRLMLNTVPGVQRKICFVPVHAADIVSFQPFSFGQRLGHLVGNLHKQIVMIERVKFPQIDF